MVGSVYVKFSDEEGAAAALQGLQGRFYGGRPIQIEFSPVTDFREATCRQYEENTCTRGGYCNFMHLRPISRYTSATVISIPFDLHLCMHMQQHFRQCFGWLHISICIPFSTVVLLSSRTSLKLTCCCRDLRKALFGRYKRKERVDDDRRDDRGRGGPRPGGRDDFRDRRRDRSPDRRGR